VCAFGDRSRCVTRRDGSKIATIPELTDEASQQFSLVDGDPATSCPLAGLIAPALASLSRPPICSSVVRRLAPQRPPSLLPRITRGRPDRRYLCWGAA